MVSRVRARRVALLALHEEAGRQVTPDKRATLLKAATLLVASALLVGGYITKDIWLAALMGA